MSGFSSEFFIIKLFFLLCYGKKEHQLLFKLSFLIVFFNRLEIPKVSNFIWTRTILFFLCSYVPWPVFLNQFWFAAPLHGYGTIWRNPGYNLLVYKRQVQKLSAPQGLRGTLVENHCPRLSNNLLSCTTRWSAETDCIFHFVKSNIQYKVRFL